MHIFLDVAIYPIRPASASFGARQRYYGDLLPPSLASHVWLAQRQLRLTPPPTTRAGRFRAALNYRIRAFMSSLADRTGLRAGFHKMFRAKSL